MKTSMRDSGNYLQSEYCSSEMQVTLIFLDFVSKE